MDNTGIIIWLWKNQFLKTIVYDSWKKSIFKNNNYILEKSIFKNNYL